MDKLQTLFRAIQCNDIRTVRKILDSGCDLHQTGMPAKGWKQRLLEFILKFLRFGVLDQTPCTPLMLAVECKNEPMVDLILAHHADINFCTDEGVTPLSWATGLEMFGYLEIFSHTSYDGMVEFLLRRGADPHFCNSHGASILHFAVSMGSLKSVSILIERGVDLNAQEFSGRQTPLMEAVEAGDLEKVKLLLEAGADLNSKDHEGKIVSEYACLSWMQEIRDLLAAYKRRTE